jgi:flagellar motor switch protein FliG
VSANLNGRVNLPSPARRAAIIIWVLGETYARPIVARLDDEALGRVMLELQQISMVPEGEVIEIVVDFLKTLERNTGAIHGGEDRARALMAGVVDPSRLKLIMSGDDEGAGAFDDRNQESVWQRLEDKPGEQIAAYLDGLSPHISSIIVNNLSTEKSSEVLTYLNQEKVTAVIADLVELPKNDDGLDMVVGRMVELEFMNKEPADAGDAPHLAKMGEVLTLIQKPRRNLIMDFLRASHEPQLHKIEHSFLSIDRLPELLSSASVPVIFREIDAETMGRVYVCLKTAYPEVATFLLENISSRMADQIKYDTEKAAAPEQNEIDEVERDFLTRLMAMKRRELIDIKEQATE